MNKEAPPPDGDQEARSRAAAERELARWQAPGERERRPYRRGDYEARRRRRDRRVRR